MIEMLAPGTRVAVIVRDVTPEWPFKALFRFVGKVTECDSIQIAVQGQVDRYGPCPTPVPEGWPMRKVQTRRFLWGKTVEIEVPEEYGWHKDPTLGTMVFPVAHVCIFVAQPEEAPAGAPRTTCVN